MSKQKPIRLKQGYTAPSPIPTRVISNEEFVPPPQTFKQVQVEWLHNQASEPLSPHFLAKFSRPLKKITSFGERTPSSSPPQWQIEAFRCFQIPDELQERYGYPVLSKDLKTKAFSVNVAKLFKVHIE